MPRIHIHQGLLLSFLISDQISNKKYKWTLSKTYIPVDFSSETNVDFSSETNVELSSEINVVDWWLLINIVDLIFSSVLILKSKNKNMKLDLSNYLKICKIHLYIS